MNEKTKYIIEPALEFGEKEILQIINFRVAMINKKKNLYIEKELIPEETLTIMLYWIDRISNIVNEMIISKRKEIDKITKEIINKWKEACEPVACTSLPNCEYQITVIKERLENLYEYKDRVEDEYKHLCIIKEKLNEAGIIINKILNNLDIHVEQDFVLI